MSAWVVSGRRAGGQGGRLVDLGLIAAFGLGLAYFVFKIFDGDPQRHTDFHLIWVAGRVWWLGGDPYGAQHTWLTARLFPEARATEFALVYPPAWWSPAVLFGQLGRHAGLMAWNLTGALLVPCAVAGWRRALRLQGQPVSWRLCGAVLVYLFFMSATGSTFAVGQVSFVVLAGTALLALGLASRSDAIAAIGLMLLLLKPQLGLVFLLSLLALPAGWRIVATGLAGTLLLSLPACLRGGFSLGEFLVNLAHYRDIPYDLPIAMTGLAHFLDRYAGYQASAIGLALGAGLVAAALLHLGLHAGLHAGRRADARDLRLFFLVSLGCIAGIVSMHVYDLPVLGSLIFLLPSLRGGTRACVVVGLLLLWRPENVARLVHASSAYNSGAVLVAAIGGLFLLAAALLEVAAGRRPAGAAAPSPAVAVNP